MSNLDRLSAWVDAYIQAWNSNDESEITALFTPDAEYFTDPYSEPWTPRTTIVSQWLENRDRPGETTFTWKPLVVGSELNIVTGETTYPTKTYSNLWEITLAADGRCSRYVEWWMTHP